MKAQCHKLTISIMFSIFLIFSSVYIAQASPISEVNIKTITANTEQGFTHTIGEKTYQMEYMTEEAVENTKSLLDNMDFSDAAINDFSIKFNTTTKSTSQPGAFTLTTDADLPDTDGVFYLNWTESLDANNYTVFSHTGLITEINSTITWMVNETTNNYVHTSGYSDGIYYFVVVAANDVGVQWSNIVIVHVDVPGNNIPGYSILILLISAIGLTVVLLKSAKNTHR